LKQNFDNDNLHHLYWFFFAVVIIGATMLLIQQFSGINAVVFFSTTVFRSSGITSDVAASALVGVANVLGALPTLIAHA
jgi:hypothetical protein